MLALIEATEHCNAEIPKRGLPQSAQKIPPATFTTFFLYDTIPPSRSSDAKPLGCMDLACVNKEASGLAMICS